MWQYSRPNDPFFQDATTAGTAGSDLMLLNDGQDFTWESICEDCGAIFECSRHIPKRKIAQMEREGHDDCIHEYMAETSNERVRVCPKCRRR